MSEIPDAKKCLVLLKKSGCSDEVIRHCIAVRDVAVRIARYAGADVKLVEAGALLHDIGRSRTHSILHAVEGVKIAKQLGLPISIIKIIECHIGAGLPKEEAALLGLPAKDYIPETLEEKIVSHADNLTDGDKRQKIEDKINKALRKGQKTHAERLMILHKELCERCNIDLDEL